MCCIPLDPQSAFMACQAEQTKYEARIVGLQRAKLEAAAKADAQWQRAEALQQELDKLAGEKTRCHANATCSLHTTLQAGLTSVADSVSAALTAHRHYGVGTDGITWGFRSWLISSCTDGRARSALRR